MEQYFPRLSVIVGLEHTSSLLFEKAMALRPIHEMCQFAKLVRSCVARYFKVCLIDNCSTFLNSPRMYLDPPIMKPMQYSRKYPIFNVHNNGRVLYFIEPSECRMCGEVLQLLMILHLKDTIMEYG